MKKIKVILAIFALVLSVAACTPDEIPTSTSVNLTGTTAVPIDPPIMPDRPK